MFVRRAMRGNHDAGSWRGVVGRLFANALSAKLFADDRVVHQLAQNGEGRFPGEGLRLRDGIADPEQIPKCSATMTFIYFVPQSLWAKFLRPSVFVIPSENASPARIEESLTRENN